jgi:hypothetical protein
VGGLVTRQPEAAGIDISSLAAGGRFLARLHCSSLVLGPVFPLDTPDEPAGPWLARNGCFRTPSATCYWPTRRWFG